MENILPQLNATKALSEPNLHSGLLTIQFRKKSPTRHTIFFLLFSTIFQSFYDYKTKIQREVEEEGKETLSTLDNKQFYRFVTFYLIYCCFFSVVYTKIKEKKMVKKNYYYWTLFPFHIHILHLRFHLFRLRFFAFTIEILIWIVLLLMVLSMSSLSVCLPGGDISGSLTLWSVC